MSDTSVGPLLDKCLALQHLDVTGCLRVSDLPLLSLESGLSVSTSSLLFPHPSLQTPTPPPNTTPHSARIGIWTRTRTQGRQQGVSKGCICAAVASRGPASQRSCWYNRSIQLSACRVRSRLSCLACAPFVASLPQDLCPPRPIKTRHAFRFVICSPACAASTGARGDRGGGIYRGRADKVQRRGGCKTRLGSLSR